MIAVVFALPEESGEFCAQLQNRRAEKSGDHRFPVIAGALSRQSSERSETVEILVFHTGVGAAAVKRELPSFLESYAPKAVISAGFGGGLDPHLASADLMLAENFTAEKFRKRLVASAAPAIAWGRLLTAEKAVELCADKAARHRETGAQAVDMETATLAAILKDRGIPLLAVRVISDAADADLPVPFAHWFDLTAQRPRPASLLWFLAKNPLRILPFSRFVRGLRPARTALARWLVSTLESGLLDP